MLTTAAAGQPRRPKRMKGCVPGRQQGIAEFRRRLVRDGRVGRAVEEVHFGEELPVGDLLKEVLVLRDEERWRQLRESLLAAHDARHNRPVKATALEMRCHFDEIKWARQEQKAADVCQLPRL